MANVINATSTGNGGLVSTGDDSGILNIQTNETTAITVDASQNVGIGTTTMTRKVNIGAATASGVSLQATGTSGGKYSIFATDSGASVVGALGIYDDTAGAYRMAIDSSGNVGIGTTSPSYKLDAWTAATSTTVGNNTVGAFYSNGNGYDVNIRMGDNVNASTRLGYISGSMYMYTNGAERMRIDTNGVVLVGATSSSGGKLQVLQSTTNSDTAVFRNSSASPYGVVVEFTGADPNNTSNYVFGGYDSFSATWMYRIWSNGTVTARSDARWKKNVETTRNGYADDLSRLRVVKYNWYNQDDGAPKELGFIAQEVEEVFPNLVQTDPVIKKREVTDEQGNVTKEEYQDGTSKSIKVSVLTPMLVKAIQELKAINDTQAELISGQAETINALTARIVALESRGTV